MNNLKVILYRTMIAVTLITAIACSSNEPKIDASTSEFLLDQSITLVENSLTDADKKTFKESLKYIKALYLNPENKELKGTQRQRIESYHDMVNNKNAQEIVQAATGLKEKYGAIKI